MQIFESTRIQKKKNQPKSFEKVRLPDTQIRIANNAVKQR